jgi:hypothetical protein
MFLTLTMKEGGTVGFGGSQTGKIIGIGTISNSSISINNVWFVDGLMDQEPGNLNIETVEKAKFCHRVLLICPWQRP